MADLVLPRQDASSGSSGADVLLGLLKDPFGDQVSSRETSNMFKFVLTSSQAPTKLLLCLARNQRRPDRCGRPNLLLSETLQQRRLRASSKTCGQQACAAACQ